MKPGFSKVAGVLPLVCLISIASYPCAAEDLLQGGDFEKRQSPFADWTIKADRAKVDVNRIGSDWIPITVTFNSGPYDQALLVIGAYGTPGGRCWIDNARPEGFEVVNPSFEDEPGFLPLPDEAPKRNWRILPPPKPGGWFRDYSGTHHVSNRASHGKHSAMLSDPAMATQMIRIWQAVRVKPHTDYSYTFDFFMSEDFTGSVSCPVLNVEFDLPGKYDPLGGVHAVAGTEGLNVADLVADRAAAGYQQCRLTLERGRAELSRPVSVPARVHLEAGIAVRTQTLEGRIALAVLDAASQQTLAEASTDGADGVWQTLRLPFVSASESLTVRIVGSGQGSALIDGVYVSRPRLRPAAQSIKWSNASNDFILPTTLGYTIKGDSADVLATGLAILRKDLKALGVELAETAERAAALKIATSNDALDHGDEAYGLDVTHEGIRIRGATEQGAFYGVMTLLQLLSARAGGEPAVIACEITDWADLPWRALNRGAPGLTPEWLARRKANIAFHVGKDLSEWRRHGIEPVPHDNITHFPYHSCPPEWPDVLKNPNMAEGVAKEEKLRIVGQTPVELSERNVIRTKLIDVTVKSEDRKTAYTLGKDFRVIDGEISCPFKDDAKPFAIARIAGGGLADGATVVVSYEHVLRRTGRGPALCLAEPEPQEAIAQMAKEMVARDNLPFIGLHVSEEPRIIGKGPRCQATGLTASELLARYYERLDKAVKEVNPGCRIITHADDFMRWQHSARSGLADMAKMLPKDAILSCWHYNAGDSVAYVYKTANLWTECGHDFFLVPMYDLRNIHVFSAGALWARSKGMPCLGLSDWSYHLGPYKDLKRPAPFIEEALCCAWHVPKKGEKGYVDFEAEVGKIADQLGK